MTDHFEHLFVGSKKRMFQALRDAGLKGAMPHRNVPWVNTADNGMSIVTVWRHSLRKRRGKIYRVFARKPAPERNPSRRSKQAEQLRVLAKASGTPVRVMLLDERLPKRGASGFKYDDVLWTVHDLGNRYELRRGTKGTARHVGAPIEPEGFGVVSPKKRARVSEQIERLGRVRRATLERADHQCEIPECHDNHEFKSLDVHHITRLGDAGSDHTDNTVALCPACHVRIHRGTRSVQSRLEAVVECIRSRRLKERRQRPRT